MPGKTIVEKILGAHAQKEVVVDEIVDVAIDARAARDFGGANVVKNLEEHNLGIQDPARTFFTFDCNPTGSDQKYATNQQRCRIFARNQGIQVFDINAGIGTHLAIDNGLVGPGGTLISTDSHANILGAIGAFGQGMGDQDIAYAFANGRVWFKVPPSIKIILKGTPGPNAQPKDIVLAMLKRFGANGLLGVAAEVYGPAADALSLDGRITVASMGTEMGAIIVLFPPNDSVIQACRAAGATDFQPQLADADAVYQDVVEVDVDGLEPMVSRPGHPEDVIELSQIEGQPLDSVFIGSCTNGRLDDLRAAAALLKGRKIAPGVVLKIVPSTDTIWQTCLKEGIIATFKDAGALVSNAGCAGCAAGQVGQNGPGEITLSTGNRNFPGKQGKGKVFLASPTVAAASAIAGCVAHPARMDQVRVLSRTTDAGDRSVAVSNAPKTEPARPNQISGRVWVIRQDNIDTDMIFHNRHLAITELSEMGPHTFGNLAGWEDFSQKAKKGDIVVTGANFGCGSSRQQAVDCFKSLGIMCVVAKSFGAIYERNAINSGMPILCADVIDTAIQDGHEVIVDFHTGIIKNSSLELETPGTPFSDVQMRIYQQGGLLG